ncbi:conserved hypothetical protein [Hahella chejuensis KCTC 2396]|uniref:DUF2793 domain-containing protein n=1 Tax=Hahella chejuensis (strain KCTC 2396) TaxID=349521 RepID=Q2SAL8_HAHCH|nr:DUF2793 domain-containing protein [Hahella chejuensis]ABC32306.1 conserved hypothetical protein [Hahella chejuensis KCTC 2396]
MSARTDPNLGLNYGWSTGESGWAAGMDANLKRLGALVGLSVKGRHTSAPPATAQEGDRYLIPVNATGEWENKAGQVAVRIQNAWDYYTPQTGWLCFVEEEARLCAYTGTDWSAGVSL